MDYKTRYFFVRAGHSDYLVIDGKHTPGKVMARVTGWEAYDNVVSIVRALEAYNKTLYDKVLGGTGDGST
jgi:hypothetical protein